MKVKISVLKTVPACYARDKITPGDIKKWNAFPGFRKPCHDFRRGFDEKNITFQGMFYAEIMEMTVSLN